MATFFGTFGLDLKRRRGVVLYAFLQSTVTQTPLSSSTPSHSTARQDTAQSSRRICSRARSSWSPVEAQFSFSNVFEGQDLPEIHLKFQ